MRVHYLIIFLICGMFAGQGWAPPPGQGGATGGGIAGPDVKSCDLKPQEQTKISLKDKSGKIHHICTGVAICGGKGVPVSCKVSERESCPIAKQCIVFNPKSINEDYLTFVLDQREKLTYTVTVDTSKALQEPTQEKLAFVLEVEKNNKRFYSEPHLRWKSRKVYQILNKDITEKLIAGPQFINMWNFIDAVKEGIISFELSIAGKVIIKRYFGPPRSRPPGKPDIPDPFPFDSSGPWFPGEDPTPSPTLSDPRAIIGNITKILIIKSNLISKP